MSGLRHTPEELEQIDQKAIDLYTNYGWSLIRIGKEFNVNYNSLSDRLKKKGIKIRIGSTKYSVDTSYFSSINTEEQAYWLGFLMADGNVYNGVLNITLCEQDKYHLEKFAKCIKTEAPVRIAESYCDGKFYPTSRISVCNKELCNDLVMLGCIPGKTLSLKYPGYLFNDQRTLHKHFIRGYFDGDGSLTYINGNIKTRRPSFSCGSLGFLESIAKIVESQIGIAPSVREDTEGNRHMMYIDNQDSVRKFLDYLYKDATVWLFRNYETYLQYIMPSGVEMLQITSGEKIWNPEMGIRGEGVERLRLQ